MMTAYASRTGTKRNLAALRLYGWRLLVSAAGPHRNEGFPYAIDNGAWSAYTHGTKIDLQKFQKVLDNMGRDSDWVVVPDIVCGGRDSLLLSVSWLPEVLSKTRVAMLAVQPGIEPEDVAEYLGPRVGVFVGGDTDWKLETMPSWASLAKTKNALCHIARVNTVKRINLCAAAGADSFDGSSPSRFSCNAQMLDKARRQEYFQF